MSSVTRSIARRTSTFGSPGVNDSNQSAVSPSNARSVRLRAGSNSHSGACVKTSRSSGTPPHHTKNDEPARRSTPSIFR